MSYVLDSYETKAENSKFRQDWLGEYVMFAGGEGSVAAIFEYTAYSKLAAGKISNMGIFEYTYVYSNIHGHFVARCRI